MNSREPNQNASSSISPSKEPWLQKLLSLYLSIDLTKPENETIEKLNNIEILLNNHKEESNFQREIQEFKKYIHRSDNPNPTFFRNERIPLFLDAYYVKETKAFKQLNDLLIEHITPTHSTYEIISTLMIKTGKALQDGVQYSISHPIESLVLMIALYGVAKSMASPLTSESTIQNHNSMHSGDSQQNNLNNDLLFYQQNDKILLSNPSVIPSNPMNMHAIPSGHGFFTFPNHQHGHIVTPSNDVKPEQTGQIYGIPIIDISLSKKSCVKKEIGHSDGKVCIIHGKKYFMKNLQDEHQDAFLGSYNLKFLQKNIGIHTPEPIILSDAGHLYFASEAIANFTPATELSNSNKNVNPEQIRTNIVEKIGENGIARLIVAMTFIDDLKPENWGHDENGLVIIDADIAPRTLDEFLLRTNKISNHEISVPLTLNNIKEMKQIYEDMLTKSLPTISNPSAKISDETYLKILNIYIQSCQMTIENFSQLPTARSPSWNINENFAKNIISASNQEKHQQQRKYC